MLFHKKIKAKRLLLRCKNSIKFNNVEKTLHCFVRFENHHYLCRRNKEP